MVRKANFCLLAIVLYLGFSWLKYPQPTKEAIFSVIAIDATKAQLASLIQEESIEKIYWIGSKKSQFPHPKIEFYSYDKEKGPLAEIIPIIHKLNPESELLIITDTVEVQDTFIEKLKINHSMEKTWCSLDACLQAKVFKSKLPLHLAFLSHQPTWVAARALLFQKIDFRHLLVGPNLIQEAWAKALMVPVMEMSLSHQVPLTVNSCPKDDWNDHARYAFEIEALRKRKGFPDLSELKKKKHTLELMLFSSLEDDLAYFNHILTTQEKKASIQQFPLQTSGFATNVKRALQNSCAEYIAIISPNTRRFIDPQDLNFVSKNSSQGLVLFKSSHELEPIMPHLAAWGVQDFVCTDHEISLHPRHMLIKKLMLHDFEDFEALKRVIFTGKSKDVILVRP